MSYSGFSRNSEKYREQTWPDRYMVFKTNDVQLIKDGRVLIVIPDLELVIDAPVRGTKGLGTADADQITVPNSTHYFIMLCLRQQSGDPSFTNDEIMDLMDRESRSYILRSTGSTQKWKPIDRNATRRPLSELLRKGVLYADESKKNCYKINKKRIEEIEATNKF